jgi:hypothetical protein
MVYKLISEWRSKDGLSHELTVYKYNYSFDLIMRYHYKQGDKCVTFASQTFGSEQGMLEGEIKVMGAN